MSQKNFVLGGIAGGLVGIAAALLLAPKSGKELINLCFGFFCPLDRIKASRMRNHQRTNIKNADDSASARAFTQAQRAKKNKTEVKDLAAPFHRKNAKDSKTFKKKPGSKTQTKVVKKRVPKLDPMEDD